MIPDQEVPLPAASDAPKATHRVWLQFEAEGPTIGDLILPFADQHTHMAGPAASALGGEPFSPRDRAIFNMAAVAAVEGRPTLPDDTLVALRIRARVLADAVLLLARHRHVHPATTETWESAVKMAHAIVDETDPAVAAREAAALDRLRAAVNDVRPYQLGIQLTLGGPDGVMIELYDESPGGYTGRFNESIPELEPVTSGIHRELSAAVDDVLEKLAHRLADEAAYLVPAAAERRAADEGGEDL